MSTNYEIVCTNLNFMYFSAGLVPPLFDVLQCPWFFGTNWQRWGCNVISAISVLAGTKIICYITVLSTVLLRIVSAGGWRRNALLGPICGLSRVLRPQHFSLLWVLTGHSTSAYLDPWKREQTSSFAKSRTNRALNVWELQMTQQVLKWHEGKVTCSGKSEEAQTEVLVTMLAPWKLRPLRWTSSTLKMMLGVH